MVQVWPEDVEGKTTEEAIALAACWFVSIGDAATSAGMKIADLATALEVAQRELFNS